MADSLLSLLSGNDGQALPAPDALLETVLAVAQEGMVLLRPVQPQPAGPITDFSFARLNPAAQQLLQLPPQPTLTHAQQFPQAHGAGAFAFFCRAYESGENEQLALRYHPADEQAPTLHLVARRIGGALLVSFTPAPAPAPDRTTLQAQLAQEQVARAEAETQRDHLHALFMQAPALITIFEGPAHVFKLVNPRYQALVGDRPLLNKPIREAMPELAGQPIFALLDGVYHSGEAFFATEMLVQLDHTNSGALGQNYYNFVYQPTRSTTGAVNGILVFAYEVTAQVRARHQAEESELLLRHLNAQLAETVEELAATNEELTATNEELAAANLEIQTNNRELFLTHQALQNLNTELELRVLQRTREVHAARSETERQRARLERFFMQAPAAICVLDGPTLVYELVNPSYQRLFPGRQLLHKPLLEALPELAQQPIWDILQTVYQTGEPVEGKAVPLQLATSAGEPPEDRYLNFTYQARHDEDGRTDGVLVFAYEVTEQVLAQQQQQHLSEQLADTNAGLRAANDSIQAANVELAQANHQLMRINQDLDNFVYAASHDLKQPINNMAGIFEELKHSATFHDPEAELLVTMFEGALQQIGYTIQDLAEVVQVERRHQQLPPEVLELLPLTQSVIQSMHDQVAAKQARFELDFAAVPAIRFARLNLHSLLYNLLSNALKYAHPNRPPMVRVSTRRTAQGTPQLLVQDNGLGLDLARYGATLFQMFRRFHDHVTGSGVGLYLVKRIVQQEGGQINVESVVDEGTTFIISLPTAAL